MAHPAHSTRNRWTVLATLATVAAAAAIAVITPGYWILATVACYLAAAFLIWPLITEARAAINWRHLKSEFWVGATAGAILFIFGTVLIFEHPVAANAQNNQNCINYGPNGTIKDSCNTMINPLPPRDPHALYQYGERVGSISQADVDSTSKTITFSGLHLDNAQTSENFEYGDVILQCPGLNALISGHFRNVPNLHFAETGPEKCNIVGIRSK